MIIGDEKLGIRELLESDKLFFGKVAKRSSDTSIL